MRKYIFFIMAIVIAVTCWPTDNFAQANNRMWRNQQMMNQNRMMQQQQQQRMQQQRMQQQRMQQQRMQQQRMQQQRQRQQAAMQQRQRDMRLRQEQMRVQRAKLAEQRRLQQQKRQQEMQRKQVQRQQAVNQKAQQNARIARDRAERLQRERRLQELRKRTLHRDQEQKRQREAQRSSSLAMLAMTRTRASAVNTQNFAQRRQAATQNFAKLRASRPDGAATGGSNSGGGNKYKSLVVANKQYQQQKLQEFKNRQAVKGAKNTKQDATQKAVVRGPNDFAKLSGILRDAKKGKGNFGLGSANREQAMAMGKAWVGKDYKVASDGKTLVSKDGLRQFRPPSNKRSSMATTGVQANFQRREKPEGGWTHNGHVNIVN